MNDIDEIRSALSDATQLSGEMHARPTAAAHIRSDAIRRRQRTRAAAAVAVSSCVALVAGVFALGTFAGEHTATELPASEPSASASASAEPTPKISIAPGPRTFATPLDLHRVLAAYPGTDCPADVETVMAVDGSECFQLAPSSMAIREVDDLQQGLQPNYEGMVTPASGTVLQFSMTEEDTAAFFALTKDVAPLQEPKNRVAMVVKGKVYFAPTTVAIPGGEVEISFDDGTDLGPFLAALGVEYSVR